MENKTNKRILGLLPARSGSKGIKGKNIKYIMGKPLLGWAAEALVNTKNIDYKMCCSDSYEILNVAKNFGLETPWVRPKNLARDDSLVVDVVINALNQLHKNFDYKFTHVVLVQATSPTVLFSDIDNAIKLLSTTNSDTVISGTVVDHHHPQLMFIKNKSKQVEWLNDVDQRMSLRQDFQNVFVRTGLVYVVSVDTIIKKKTLYGDKISALIIPKERSINIDCDFDFKIAELILKDMYS